MVMLLILQILWARTIPQLFPSFERLGIHRLLWYQKSWHDEEQSFCIHIIYIVYWTVAALLVLKPSFVLPRIIRKAHSSNRLSVVPDVLLLSFNSAIQLPYSHLRNHYHEYHPQCVIWNTEIPNFFLFWGDAFSCKPSFVLLELDWLFLQTIFRDSWVGLIIVLIIKIQKVFYNKYWDSYS